jgi:hypothetical protein
MQQAAVPMACWNMTTSRELRSFMMEAVTPDGSQGAWLQGCCRGDAVWRPLGGVLRQPGGILCRLHTQPKHHGAALDAWCAHMLRFYLLGCGACVVWSYASM